jgi:hypothetical protein
MPYYPPDQVGTGTVTSIIASTGLSGGTITTSGTIANTGALSVAAGTGVTVSGTGSGPYTGAITVTNAGVLSVTGTTNQVAVSAATGAVTFSLPQSIHTGATPQFARLGLGAAADSTILLLVSGGNSKYVVTQNVAVATDAVLDAFNIPSGTITITGGNVDITTALGFNLATINRQTITKSDVGGCTVSHAATLFLGGTAISTGTMTGITNASALRISWPLSSSFGDNTHNVYSIYGDAATNVTLGNALYLGYWMQLPSASTDNNGTVKAVTLVVTQTAGNRITAQTLLDVSGTTEAVTFRGINLGQTIAQGTTYYGFYNLSAFKVSAASTERTMTDYYGYYYAPAVKTGDEVTSTAIVTNMYGAYFANCAKSGSGTATLTNQYGLYVAALTTGATINVGVYIGGASGAATTNYALWVDAGTSAFGGAVVPDSSDVAALGSATLMWGDLFLASGGVINWDNGNYTLTHATGALTASGTFSTTRLGIGAAADANQLLTVAIPAAFGSSGVNDCVKFSFAASTILTVQTRVLFIDASVNVVNTTGQTSMGIFVLAPAGLNSDCNAYATQFTVAAGKSNDTSGFNFYGTSFSVNTYGMNAKWTSTNCTSSVKTVNSQVTVRATATTTITTVQTVNSAPTISAATSTTNIITNMQHFYAANIVKAVAGGTETVTNQYGLYVESMTSGGTINYGIYVGGAYNATATNYSIYVDAGFSRFDASGMTVASGASAVLRAFTVGTPGSADTVTISGVDNIITATGFNFFEIQAPIYSNTSVVVTNAATLYISGAPTATGGGSITNAYALWVDAGTTRLDGRLLCTQGADVGSGTSLTLGSDGNTFEITGTTQIDQIVITGWQNGSVITLVFNESVTVRHGIATSGANVTILLAGAGNFSATANDTLTLVLCETTAAPGQAWRELARTVI